MANLTYRPESVTAVGETDIEQEAFSFFWTINNYSAIMTGLTSVESPIFRGGGPKGDYGWKLSLSKREPNLLFYLGLSDYGEEEDDAVKVNVNYEAAILRANGQLLPMGYNLETAEFVKSGLWSGKLFIGLHNLTDPSLKLVVDDKVKILCKIWILGALNHKVRNGGSATLNPSDLERIRISKEGLTQDLGKMFKESTGTDITIATNKTTFKAHKVILSGRSSVFAAMLSADMLEKERNIVKITDFDDDVVYSMLEHLYTGETSAMADRAPELLQIAEKYDLSGLKLDCEYVMTEKLSMENAAAILVLAETHNASYLKTRALDFIKLNKVKLLTSKSFRDVVKPLADAGTLVDLVDLSQD